MAASHKILPRSVANGKATLPGHGGSGLRTFLSTLTHASNRALMIASQSNLVDEIVTIKVGTGDEQNTFQ